MPLPSLQEEIEKRIDAILPVLADQGYTKEDLLNAFATNANSRAELHSADGRAHYRITQRNSCP